MLIYNPEKKFGNKPGSKENLGNFFCNKSNIFLMILFLKRRGWSCFVPFFVPCACSYSKKKSKKWKKNDEIKIFVLWNVFQKTISNLSELTSKICLILDFFAILAIFGAKWPIWKFENFGPELRIQFWFFWKKFWRQKFLFVMCSFDFHQFFLNIMILKAFYHLILKILKKLTFLKKHWDFTRTLKFFLEFDVMHLKMT